MTEQKRRGPLMNRTMNQPEKEAVEHQGKPYQQRNLRDANGRQTITNNTAPDTTKEEKPDTTKES